MLDEMTNLAGLLKDPDLLATKGYLAGDWVDGASGETFDVTNPARGDVIAQVADFSRAQAAEAIAAAQVAQKEWAARTGKERSVILRGLDWSHQRYRPMRHLPSHLPDNPWWPEGPDLPTDPPNLSFHPTCPTPKKPLDFAQSSLQTILKIAMRNL